MSPKNSPPVDDNPEWTDADFVRARRASEVHGAEFAKGMVRKVGRPLKRAEDRKTQVTMRFSRDLLEAMRATGPGWSVRAEEALRQKFLKRA